jgi:hypothetical protein
VDENGRPDLLVGAILSQDGVVLRALEIVKFNPQSLYRVPSKAINPDVNSKLFSYGDQ